MAAAALAALAEARTVSPAAARRGADRRLGEALAALRSDLSGVPGGAAWLPVARADRLDDIAAGKPRKDAAETLAAVVDDLADPTVHEAEQAAFLSRPSWRRLAAAAELRLTLSAGPERSVNDRPTALDAARLAVRRFVTAFERYERDAADEAARTLAAAAADLDAVVPGTRFASLPADLYDADNYRVYIGEGLLRRFVAETRRESGAVSDVFRGTRVTGTQTTDVAVDVDVRPEVGAARFDLIARRRRRHPHGRPQPAGHGRHGRPAPVHRGEDDGLRRDPVPRRPHRGDRRPGAAEHPHSDGVRRPRRRAAAGVHPGAGVRRGGPPAAGRAGPDPPQADRTARPAAGPADRGAVRRGELQGRRPAPPPGRGPRAGPVAGEYLQHGDGDAGPRPAVGRRRTGRDPPAGPARQRRRGGRPGAPQRDQQRGRPAEPRRPDRHPGPAFGDPPGLRRRPARPRDPRPAGRPGRDGRNAADADVRRGGPDPGAVRGGRDHAGLAGRPDGPAGGRRGAGRGGAAADRVGPVRRGPDAGRRGDADPRGPVRRPAGPAGEPEPSAGHRPRAEGAVGGGDPGGERGPRDDDRGDRRPPAGDVAAGVAGAGRRLGDGEALR